MVYSLLIAWELMLIVCVACAILYHLNIWLWNSTTMTSYLHFIITEPNDTQSFSHQLPFIAVINGAHFGTITL